MADPDSQGTGAKTERWRWRNLPTWGKWIVGTFAILIIMSIGSAITDSSSKEDDLKSELSATKAKLHRAEEDEASAKQEAASVMQRKEAILSRAKSAASRLRDAAGSERDRLQSQVSSKRSELNSVESDLAQTNEELSGAEQAKQLSTIPGNGTFKKEADYMPGTYRSEGGPGCYWATLNSADPMDIASNENASGPTIASIHTPYFQTDGCGEWQRIGE